MKSSIMTMSCWRSSFGPGATSPVLIRTDAMRASSNLMPKKDRLPSPGAAGTILLEEKLAGLVEVLDHGCCRCAVAARAPLPSGWSTSVNTAPKPLTVAGALPLVPGMEKDASVMLLPTGVNNRDRLNALKIGAVGRIAKEHRPIRPESARTEEPAKAPTRVF